MSGPTTIARVALNVPVATLFDYRTDGHCREDIGRRVVVPFGKRTAIGVIVECTDASAIPAARLKPVLEVLRNGPGFDHSDLALFRFASDYYHHPLGEVVMGALPVRLRTFGTVRPRQVSEVRLTELGAALDPHALPARAVAKRALLELLNAGPLSSAQIRARLPGAARLVRELSAAGYLAVTRKEPESESSRASFDTTAAAAPVLTSEQAAAVERICENRDAFQAHLLLGVAGSGKTEVYLHAIADILGRGGQALVLVPEIALTPQLEALVSARFPCDIACLHSGLNESERLAHWVAAQSGRARIVLGTRLSVFTPMPDLGIVIVDEEHDASFKQDEGFRYSARDLAVVRARQRGIPVVLGSATPALETYYNAVSGRYALHLLTQRIGAPPPAIESVDTRSERLRNGLSARLLHALRASCERGEQSLVFINRRGYAPVLSCRSCGWVSACHRCAAQLVLHLKDRQLRCHHCGHQAVVPAACPQCGNQDLAPVGQGTQRIETALESDLAGARVLRIDRDSTRRRDSWPDMRRRIRGREVDVLVGTQILAKGHDFPHLNLVGIVNADALLYSADVRAAERLFALLTQVAGRAGRGQTRGTVLIQTEFPGHPLYEALKRHDYRSFADDLLAERRQAGFPPFVHQALLRAEAPRLAVALDFLAQAARLGNGLAAAVTLYDPVPATLPRRAGRERAQLLVQAESRPLLQRFLRDWRALLSTGRSTRARWSLDVDPLEF